MDYITILKLLSFYLLYPIFLILKYTGFVLLSIAAPFVNLARYGMQGCLWPLRFLTKFEVKTHPIQPSVLQLIVCVDPIHLHWRCSAGRSCHRRFAPLCVDLPHDVDEPRKQTR